MNTNLVRKLIKEGVMRQNTEIEANYMGIDIAGRATARCLGTFFIQAVKIGQRSGLITFDTISTVDGQPRTVPAADVISVDGMPLDRLASIYAIDSVGGPIPQGQRRGRKPREAQA